MPHRRAFLSLPENPIGYLSIFFFFFFYLLGATSSLAANFSQSYPRSHPRSFIPLAKLFTIYFFSVGLASRHFGHTNYCFPSYFASATLRSRDIRGAVAAACSCAAVIFDHVEQRGSLPGTRRMLPRLFVLPLPHRPRYCSPRVFRTFELFACMVIWNAPRVPKHCGPVLVALFLFTMEVGQFHRALCSLKLLFSPFFF